MSLRTDDLNAALYELTIREKKLELTIAQFKMEIAGVDVQRAELEAELEKEWKAIYAREELKREAFLAQEAEQVVGGVS